MRVYLDNCCYNRPYDSQNQLTVNLETQAKIFIQQCIKDGKLNLASSCFLQIENLRNPFQERRENIRRFLEDNTSVYIGKQDAPEIIRRAEGIIATGIKKFDAYHVASAIFANCDYFITTDKRLLKYITDQIVMINPIDFVAVWEELYE